MYDNVTNQDIEGMYDDYIIKYGCQQGKVHESVKVQVHVSMVNLSPRTIIFFMYLG